MDDQIDLLLASPRENKAVLDDGMASDATNEVPKPKKDESHLRRDRSQDRSHLDVQRWGLIAPEGKAGDALLEAMKPLIDFRTEEQKAPPMVFRVPPDMDRKKSTQWLYDVYESEDIDEPDRPYYLCLLGSPEQASLEFQHTVGHTAYVGRVHFDKPDGEIDVTGYDEYARKVVRYAREGFTSEPPELLFYVAPDGSKATANAGPKLVSPTIEASVRAVEKGRFPAIVRQVDAKSVDKFFEVHASSRPSVLLTVSHGLGGSVEDYGSEDAQRLRQGALMVGHKEIVDAEAMAAKTFLPGGLWLFFACFGAGTPATSEYFKWLSQLAQTGSYKQSAKSVLSSLSSSGSGFIAALPQAALRNPNGPLGVIGHIDLAWNYSYINPSNPSESRSSKYTRVLHTMTRGARIGSAHDEITEGFRVANFELSSMYESAEDARIAGRPDPIDPKKRGQIWMFRNDLRGYVLLGDPAVRLPQAEPKDRVISKPTQASVPEIHTIAEVRTTPAAGPPSPEARGAAVRALLEGNEAPNAIASRAGCTLTQLFAWFETHRAQEREKLV